MLSTSLGSLFLRSIISSYLVHRSVLSIMVSSLRSRFLTGHILTSREQRQSGKAVVTHI